jgi:preprotein translocase SecE subunit
MIATEGEMKKVNWSTRREIIGSTKVVIVFTLLLTLVLFVVDMIFITFFGWIGVLREAPSVWEMLTGGGR